jgi:hypothetical protein
MLCEWPNPPTFVHCTIPLYLMLTSFHPFMFGFWLAFVYAHAHAHPRARAHTHTHTHAHLHARTHALVRHVNALPLNFGFDST